MADEKRATPVSHQQAETLRETAERLERRAKEIPAWKLGTIVFADRPQTPTDSRPRSVEKDTVKPGAKRDSQP